LATSKRIFLHVMESPRSFWACRRATSSGQMGVRWTNSGWMEYMPRANGVTPFILSLSKGNKLRMNSD
jgi:hypothetical protein